MLKGTRRTFAGDDAQLAAFGIGQNLSNAVTCELIRVAKCARDQLTGTPPKIVLKGVIAAEITAIATLADAYDQANWAQSQAQQTASTLLQDLRPSSNKTSTPPAANSTSPPTWPPPASQNERRPPKPFGLQPGRLLVCHQISHCLPCSLENCGRI
ncbi:MAG: hypothetical protein IPK32_00750 [Verrucomicrobiaceae bacterium]|nr:hypothetical protein [Verrucomicrobiaceae bacterium]